jgi:hypothetical protein
MTEQEMLAKLTEMGRKLVREYDRERAKYQRLTELPIECVKAAARVCMLVEVVDALGLMDGQEFDAGLRRMGDIQPEATEGQPELARDRLGEHFAAVGRDLVNWRDWSEGSPSAKDGTP